MAHRLSIAKAKPYTVCVVVYALYSSSALIMPHDAGSNDGTVAELMLAGYASVRFIAPFPHCRI